MGTNLKKEMSCIAAKTMLSYVRDRLGDEAVSPLVEASDHDLDYLLDEHHWMGFGEAQRMSERCKELLEDPEAPYTIGLASAQLRTVGPVLAMARSLGSPKGVYRFSPRFNRQFTRVVELEVPEVQEGVALVHARYEPEVEPHRNDCLYRQGVMAGVPTLWGLPAARVEEVECAARGAARCTYILRWSPLTRRGRPQLWGVTAFAGAATLGTMLLAPRVARVVAPIVVGTLAFAGFRLDRRIRRELAASREEFSALEAELHNVEEKGDALAQAKRHLEERVIALETAAAHAREVSSTLEMDEVVGLTLARLASVWESARGALLLDDAEGRPRVRAVWGDAAGELVGRAAEGSSPSGLIAWSRRMGVTGESDHVHVEPLGKGAGARGSVVLSCAARHAESDTRREVSSLLASQAVIALDNARLYELAITDGLTGLYIQRHFVSRLESEWTRVQRHGGSFALLMIDLDHFKRLNDTHGHLMGDRVLRGVAEEMRSCLRAKLDLVARYGGEEFAVILPQTGRPGACTVAEKICGAVRGLRWEDGGEPVRATCSIGVAIYEGNGPTCATEVLNQADEALYEAKRLGRDRVVASWRAQE